MKLLLLLTIAFASPGFTYGYLHTDTVLYGDPNLKTAITSLPATYFVTVLESYEDCHKVSYKDITGYIPDVEIVDFEPVTKWASTWFTVTNDGYPAKLRSLPSKDSEIIMEIPAGKTGYYYGDADGDELLQNYGNKWRYVCYNDGLGDYYGYVYSSQISVSEIKPNEIKKVEKVENNEGEELSSPNVNTDFILIACLCIPSVLIMYLLFRDKDHKSRYRD